MKKESPKYDRINEFQVDDTTEKSARIGFVHQSEDDRLLQDANRFPLEKLMLFTQMIRRERMYKHAKVIK